MSNKSEQEKWEEVGASRLKRIVENTEGGINLVRVKGRKGNFFIEIIVPGGRGFFVIDNLSPNEKRVWFRVLNVLEDKLPRRMIRDDEIFKIVQKKGLYNDADCSTHFIGAR